MILRYICEFVPSRQGKSCKRLLYILLAMSICEFSLGIFNCLFDMRQVVGNDVNYILLFLLCKKNIFWTMPTSLFNFIIWFINRVDNINWPPYRNWKADVSSVSPSSLALRSDEGLTLETSAFQFLYGGQFTLSTLLINQIFVYHSPTDAAPQFL